MRPLFFAFVLGWIVSCCPHAEIRPSSTLVARMTDETVALVWNDDGTTKVFCSGVWIGEDKILTAAHCINGLAEQQETSPDDLAVHFVMHAESPDPYKEPFAAHLGKAIQRDDDHDLALITVPGPKLDHPVAMLASETPGLGEPLWFVGHPRGLSFTVLRGSVAGYRSELPVDPKVGPWLQVQAPVFYGNSGGGCFDDAGQLVGIASMLVPVPSEALYVARQTIAKFLAHTD